MVKFDYQATEQGAQRHRTLEQGGYEIVASRGELGIHENQEGKVLEAVEHIDQDSNQGRKVHERARDIAQYSDHCSDSKSGPYYKLALKSAYRFC